MLPEKFLKLEVPDGRLQSIAQAVEALFPGKRVWIFSPIATATDESSPIVHEIGAA
jgi:hypothetical protein